MGRKTMRGAEAGNYWVKSGDWELGDHMIGLVYPIPNWNGWRFSRSLTGDALLKMCSIIIIIIIIIMGVGI